MRRNVQDIPLIHSLIIDHPNIKIHSSEKLAGSLLDAQHTPLCQPQAPPLDLHEDLLGHVLAHAKYF